VSVTSTIFAVVMTSDGVSVSVSVTSAVFAVVIISDGVSVSSNVVVN